MKRYFLGIVAVLLAVGFSSFTSKSTKNSDVRANLYYFQVAGSYLPTAAPLKIHATFIEIADENLPPAGSGCTSNQKQCVSGFTSGQVVAISGSSPVRYELIDDSRVPVQTPALKP